MRRLLRSYVPERIPIVTVGIRASSSQDCYSSHSSLLLDYFCLPELKIVLISFKILVALFLKDLAVDTRRYAIWHSYFIDSGSRLNNDGHVQWQ